MRKKGLAAVLCVSMAVSMLPAAVMAEEASSVEAETEVTSEASSEAESFDYSAGLEENGYFTDIRALDYVTLPDLSEIPVDKDTVIPAESMIESQISSLLESYATVNEITDADRKIEDGTTVNIDYVGSVDGVEFQGGSTNGMGTSVTIGVTSYIDDFLEQLIGHAQGEEFDIEVTFPDPYPNNTDLSGKDAVFSITINYIEETVIPEFDDAFVAENFPDYETAEAYRQMIEEELYNNNLYNAIYLFLETEAEVSSIPETAMETVFNERYQNLSSQAAAYGVDAETLLSYMGMTMDSFRESCTEFVSSCLVMQAVMEQMELELDDDVAKEVLGFDDSMYEMVTEFYGKPYVMFATIPQYAMEQLAVNAVLVEMEESESASEEVSEEAAESEAETEEASTEEN